MFFLVNWLEGKKIGSVPIGQKLFPEMYLA